MSLTVYSIDPGTETGIAVYDVLALRYLEIRTTTISAAMFDLRDRVAAAAAPDLVLFEDSRKMRRTRDRTSDPRRAGYGSIKRDCVIWEECLEALAIPYVASAPMHGLLKLSAETFAATTGWTGRTSNHARDAAMRAWTLNPPMVRAMIQEWRTRHLATLHAPKRKRAPLANRRAP